MTPVSSQLRQVSTPHDALLTSPFPPTVLRLQLNRTLPFHRLYYGRVSTPGTGYLESCKITFRRDKSEVWSTSFVETNYDLSTILSTGANLVQVDGVVVPPYCLYTVENSPTTPVDPQPRELLTGTDWLRAHVRPRISSTADLQTRINCAPVKVLSEADEVELRVDHHPTLTTADLFWAARIWFLAVNSSNVPA